MKIARHMAGLCALMMAAPLAADPIDLNTKTVVLAPTEPNVRHVGPLSYRGGLRLSSSDARFGGLSGLVVSTDGEKLISVTDTGHWFEARLIYDSDGTLTDLADPVMTTLNDESGQPLTSKSESDSESLAPVPGGGFLVSFERQHRAHFYAAPGASAEPPDFALGDLSGVKRNGGLEAMEFLSDGRLLLLTEDHFVADGQLAGWLVDGGAVATLTYPGNGFFKPTGLTRLADGRLLVLERGFTVIGGPKARLMMIAPPSGPGAITDLTEIARLQPPVQVDNYEGVSARTGSNGETLLYLVSDDNFSGLQRTLLLMFALTK